MGLGEVAVGVVAVSARLAAFALASCSLKAAEELAVLRAVSGVFFVDEGVATGSSPGGERASPKVPAKDVWIFGVLAAVILLLDRGRNVGVECRFCICDRGGFLIVDIGREMEGSLTGVTDAPEFTALTLLLPGTVFEPIK